MNISNVISPVQARLNFCDKDYVALLTEINNAIVDLSRKQTVAKFEWKDINTYAFNKVGKELNTHGFNVEYWVQAKRSGTIHYMNITW
jgi:hypothetical protein